MKRRRNPVPSSSYLNKIDHAKDLYERFSGDQGEVFARVRAKDVPGVLTDKKNHVLIVVGYLDGVMYDTVRDGRAEKYVHHFGSNARPLLATSHDGRTLHIVGGRFRFTERGIVDSPRRRKR